MLEAIHLLGLARSFRSTRLLPVIQYDQLACTIFGQVQMSDGRQSNLGISRNRQGEFQIRIDGQNARSAAQLAETLPLQLIRPVFHSPTARVLSRFGAIQKKIDAAAWRAFSP